MRCVKLLAVIALLDLSAVPRPAFSSPVTAPIGQDLPDIVAPLLKAVVNITVLKKPGSDPTDPPDQVIPDRAQGSGFVVSPDGYIVTNQHVIENGYDVTVAFIDGTTYPAEVVATNRRPDLALLKIAADTPVASVHFGDSDKLRIGQTVLAIGNPLGLSSSLSVGIVSALNRDVNMTMIDDFIQTDAAINHGNSGGPLFNLAGDVIGVNYAIFAPGQQTGSAGLGLAIPSNDASWIVEQMRLHGKVRPGFVGFRLQQITPEIAKALALPSRSGGIATRVLPNTPAALQGIEEGDVVLALNGRTPRDVRALLRDLSATSPGTRAVLDVWRDGKSRPVTITLADWPDNLFNPAGPQPLRDASGHKVAPDLGLKLAVADEKARQRPAFDPGPPGPNVAIADVAANSPAADLRLLPGDLILRVGTERVASPDAVRAALVKARAEGRSAVLMLVDAQGAPRWVVVPLGGPPRP